MRISVVFITILFCLSSNGQLSRLKGTWITQDQDLICIRDTSPKGIKNSNQFSNKLLENEILGLYIQSDTLKFRRNYWHNDSTFADPYDLKIIYLDDTSLIVKPISILSKNFFQNRKSIKFKRQEYSIDSSIKFEKLIYHTTFCFGNCPRISMQIDNKKNIYLDGEYFIEGQFFEIDSLLSGQFKGILSDSLYNELIRLIQTCNLRTLKFGNPIVNDAPTTTLIIYYNGQKKYLQSMDPPYIVDNLLDFFINLNRRIKLTRCSSENEKLFEW